MPKRKLCQEDDWCFDCKDGGDLLVCDHKDCGKVYHIACVQEKESSFENGKPWICGRHSCSGPECKKSPKFYCLGCPHAECNKCCAVSEFAIVRSDKGLCTDCFELVFMIENNLDHDSEGNKISLDDRETYEALFKEYWEIIKVREGLTSAEVCAALNKYKMDRNCLHHTEEEIFSYAEEERFSDIEEEDEEEEDEDEDEEEGWISLDTDNHKLGPKKNGFKAKEFKRCESKSVQTKYKAGTKRKGSKSLEFIGWGSKSIIGFLTSIGKDATETFSRWHVCCLIREYVDENHLSKFNNKFLPDEKLIPIFGKKVVSESKIYSLLKPHFVENLVQTTEEKNDDENKDSFISKLPNDQLSVLRKSLFKKGDYITRMSCFASISAENIKLVYLKQSLVRELSKQPESFEEKVIGAFVKIRADTTDHRQGNHYQIVRVLGVNNGFLLQVSFMTKAIAISELSDDDFTEQECETLQQKVKDSLLPKITVKELQAKARCLHEDITKHWILKRLVYLEKRIEYANDKGRHREKGELIDEKLELERPGKRDELLRGVPTVCPELIQEKYDPHDDDDEASLSGD